MYHSVGGKDSKHSILPEEFEKQLRYIKKHCNTVPLDDIILWTIGLKKIPPRSVALTFDDGYKDNFEIMLPLLIKYRIPATVFLTTDLSKMKQLGFLDRLDENTIIGLSESGLVNIESHAHSHVNLTSLTEVEAEQEILKSKAEIKRITGRESQFFAYPFGYRNGGVEKLVVKYFKAAVGIGEGTIKKGDNLFALKRVQVDRSVTFFEFCLRLTGAVDINRKIVDFVRKAD